MCTVWGMDVISVDLLIIQYHTLKSDATPKGSFTGMQLKCISVQTRIFFLSFLVLQYL